MHPISFITNEEAENISDNIKERMDETETGSVMFSNGQLTITKGEVAKPKEKISHDLYEISSEELVTKNISNNVTSRRKAMHSISKTGSNLDMEVSETIECSVGEAQEMAIDCVQNELNIHTFRRTSRSTVTKGRKL